MRKIRDLAQDPAYWLNYATFLMTTLNRPDSARALLQRATQALPPHEHRPVISRFGALEFQSPNGDAERGRTIYEGLVETYKNRPDVWDAYVALEMGSHGDKEKARALFERLGKEKMKPRRARNVFKRWVEFEQGLGEVKKIDDAVARRDEYFKIHGVKDVE